MEVCGDWTCPRRKSRRLLLTDGCPIRGFRNKSHFKFRERLVGVYGKGRRRSPRAPRSRITDRCKCRRGVGPGAEETTTPSPVQYRGRRNEPEPVPPSLPVTTGVSIQRSLLLDPGTRRGRGGTSQLPLSTKTQILRQKDPFTGLRSENHVPGGSPAVSLI